MKAVALLSGGIDSSLAVAIAKLEDKYDTIYTLSLDYGQKTAKKEIESAAKISEWLGFGENHKVLILSFVKEILNADLLNTNTMLLKEHGINEYVPMRNTIFLSIATAWAEAIKADTVIIGSNISDSVCPDNSRGFLEAFQQVIKEGSVDKQIKIYAPLIKYKLDKDLIIKKSLELKLPLEYTWSCHNNIDKPCGLCGNCVKRLESFASNGVIDPLEY